MCYAPNVHLALYLFLLHLALVLKLDQSLQDSSFQYYFSHLCTYAFVIQSILGFSEVIYCHDNLGKFACNGMYWVQITILHEIT